MALPDTSIAVHNLEKLSTLDTLPQETWVKKRFKNAPQILLTNDAHFNGHTSLNGYGASSFLLQIEDSVIAVSAKHLLNEVHPALSKQKFNTDLKKWTLYPRATEKLSDSNSTMVAALINTRESTDDLLLFEITSIPSSIFPLQPYYGDLILGEQLYLIGCTYAQVDCKQNFYKTQYRGVYNKDFSLMSVPGNFNFQGYSGGPVINSKGHCVGALYGGKYEAETNSTLLVFSPINLIK